MLQKFHSAGAKQKTPKLPPLVPGELDPMHDRCIFEPASRIASDALGKKYWTRLTQLFQFATRKTVDSMSTNLLNPLVIVFPLISLSLSLSLSLNSLCNLKNIKFHIFIKKKKNETRWVIYHDMVKYIYLIN